MLYLTIGLISLLVINIIVFGILYYKYIQQEKKTNELFEKLQTISKTLESINDTCEKTVVHSNSSIGELARRLTQYEITVNQVANAVNLLSSGIRPQHTYLTNQ